MICSTAPEAGIGEGFAACDEPPPGVRSPEPLEAGGMPTGGVAVEVRGGGETNTPGVGAITGGGGRGGATTGIAGAITGLGGRGGWEGGRAGGCTGIAGR